MKIKPFLISAVLSSLLLSMSVSAEPETTVKENNEVTTATTISETAVTDVTEPQKSTTAHQHGVGSVILSEEEVGSPAFFEEILNYVGEDDAANLNDNLKNNALTINSTTIDYSDKSMFTVTTRTGDVFYLIINNSDGSCLFFNAVDTADLTSLLDKSNENNSLNENAISEIEEFELQEELQKETTPSDNESEDATTKKHTTTADTKIKKKNSLTTNILWIVLGVIGAVLVAVLFMFIKKKKSSSNNSYDESFNEDFNSFNDKTQMTSDDEEIEEYMED
ncbi:MAG: DUF4366 domain-containing protein [Oscillospiraceae bacterium]|nr:DUF4366 domain-containing protein [Oscillospiraceae bacterium]